MIERILTPIEVNLLRYLLVISKESKSEASNEVLSLELNCDPRTVRNVIKSLVEKGMLRVEFPSKKTRIFLLD